MLRLSGGVFAGNYRTLVTAINITEFIRLKIGFTVYAAPVQKHAQ
jgi:hypothetical protein